MRQPFAIRRFWVALMTVNVGLAVGVGLAVQPLAATTDQPWSAPVGGSSPTVLNPFSPPAHDWLAGHRGVDLAATSGSAVRAPTAGVVTFAGRINDRNVISIDHGELVTSLEPVDPEVRVGQHVGGGDVVGAIGDGGHCSRRCLHWGVRRGDVYLDPMAQLRALLPVLKPVTPQAERRARSGVDGSDVSQPDSRQAASVGPPPNRGGQAALAVGSLAAVAATGAAIARRRKSRG